MRVRVAVHSGSRRWVTDGLIELAVSSDGLLDQVNIEDELTITGEPSRHEVNRRLYDKASRGERIADAVTGFLGSWTFIAIQTVMVAIWLAGNVYLVFHFDPYPFILLNLAFSTQAAYAAPLILLAGNRASLRDRMTLEHTAAEADFEEQQNRELLEAEQEILRRVEGLEHHILELERRILERLDALPRATG